MQFKRLFSTLAIGASLAASLHSAPAAMREVWSHNLLSASHDLGGGYHHRVIATDAAGSVFVGQEAPKLIAPFDGDLVITKYDRCGGAPAWVRTFDYLGANQPDRIVAMDTDGAGNLYVAAVGNNAGVPLWIMLKYDPVGTLLWTQIYGAAGGNPIGIKVDKAGWVAVAGTVQAGGFNYVHALKLDPFTSAPGAAGVSPLIGTGATAKAMTVDGQGNILVAANAMLAVQSCVTLRFPGALTGPAIAAPVFRTYAPAGGTAYAQDIVCDPVFNRFYVLANTFIAANQVTVLCHQDNMGLLLDPAWNGGAPMVKPLYGAADIPHFIGVSQNSRVVTLAETFTAFPDMLLTEWNPAGTAFVETISAMAPGGAFALYNQVRPAGLRVDGTGRIYITGSGYAAAPAPDFITESFLPLAAPGALPDWFDLYNSAALGGLADQAMAIALDPARNVFVAGETAGGGAGRSTVVMIAQGPPPNDTCATAMPINFGTTPFTTFFAGDTIPPVSLCLGDRKDVWFKWTAPCTGIVELDTYGSCFDTILSVYTGGCAALAPLICNDNAVSGLPAGTLQSFVRFNAIAATTYYIQVGGAGAVPAEGTGRLTLLGPFPPLGACPPAAGAWSPFRKFRMSGTGTSGAGGVWRISVPCCTDMVGLAPTAMYDLPDVLAAKLCANINTACASFNAIAVGSEVWIRTRCGAGVPFVFRVGPAGTPADALCIVPSIDVGGPVHTAPGMGCCYNPTLNEEAYADADANTNGFPDALDIATGTSADANGNGIPDESETTGPKLSLVKQANGLLLSWQGSGYILQAAPAVGSNTSWQDVTGATNSPVSLPVKQDMRFFRLRSL